MSIKKLSEKIIKQIAAGEVIQKPYNAIKEIIENSIDAESSKIDLYFQNYSLELIILIDNGIGFSKEDLLLATQLYTTSKTEETDNMFGNNFLGFRGEALSSIDAISDLTIESNNHKLINNQIYPSNIQSGTKLTIKNIFQKIPARLKFIKNPQFEFKLIKELIKKYIINYENISWNIFHNDRNIYNFKQSTKKERIIKLFKEEPIIVEQDYITAYILKQNINTSIIFVNNRPIKDKSIKRYIISLLKEYTFINEDIGYILFINIDNILVDYNVHPSKEEVKFFNYQDIFKILYKIFAMENLAHKISNNPTILINRTTLNPKNNKNIMFEDHISNSIKLENPNNFILEEPQLNLSNIINDNFLSNEKHIFDNPNKSETFNPFIQSKELNINENSFKKTFINESEFSVNNNDYKIIGQIKNSFILFETNEGIGIFDQHAAHERTIYENLKKQMKESNSQNLLTPIKLNLTVEQEEILIENKHILIKKGFILIKNELIDIPFFNKKINFKHFFETLDTSSDIQTELDRLLANIACKQAIKANHELSMYEMKILLKTALNQPPICNHGRPVFKYFSNNEILNFFKR